MSLIECEIFEISLRRGYGITNFRDDLKVLFHQIGIEERQTVFLFSAGQVSTFDLFNFIRLF